MSNLYLHCGAYEATVDQVKAIQTPDAIDGHYPLPHLELIERTREALTSCGMEVANEGHALKNGKHRGTSEAIDGAQYFGLLDVKPVKSGFYGGDHGLSIGVRNSHDQTYAASLVAGTRVFVCDNLAFSGEIMLQRRHTKHMMNDLDRLVADAFGQLLAHHNKIEQQIETFKDAELSTASMHDLVCKALRAKAIPATAVPKVLNEWHDPSHDEFLPRTAWSALNALTEVAKGWTNPTHKINRTRRFHGLLAAQIGDLAIAT